MAAAEYEAVLEQVRHLSPDEQQQLRAALETLGIRESRPRRSLLGIVADLGTAPSVEAIDEARREMWTNFPRDDI